MTGAAAPLALGLGPGSCVRGSFRPGGSKSLVQRALLLAAVAEGTSAIEGVSDAGDVQAALGALGALGVASGRAGESHVRVTGTPPGVHAGLAAGGPVSVGESGTLARLATALVALASRPGTRWTVTPRGSLVARRSAALFAALRRAGVELARQERAGAWPVELVAALPPAEVTLIDPASSQEVSALLAALAAHAGERVLLVRGPIPSAPYVRLTIDLVTRFGARVACPPVPAEVQRYLVRGPLRAPAAVLALEPDASSAAVALAAACLTGGELFVPDLGRASSQGDVRIVEHLAAFGCEARSDVDGLRARGSPVRGAELDLGGEPDLAPVLCAVAAAAALRAGASSRLAGLATLPGKESDRLSVLAAGLRALGFAVEVGMDFLCVAPGHAASAREPVLLDPRGDHRMAFAFALLSALRPGVAVHEPACVAKSWSSFWADLEGLGARLVASA
jgi:3-phosphoshikimate 1-carboxyvinyltransferase